MEGHITLLPTIPQHIVGGQSSTSMQRFLILRQRPASPHRYDLQAVADDRRMTTLAFLFLNLLSNIFSFCSGGCRKGWTCVLVVAFLFKAGWIVMGAYMFVSCDFDRCN